MIKGQVIGGELGKIVVRQKSGNGIEIGELLVADSPAGMNGPGSPRGKILFQCYDLLYGSQLSQQTLELVSGMKLEEQADMELLDPELRNYSLAYLKPLLFIEGNKASLCKSLPEFFSEVREVRKEDLGFLTRPENAIYLGRLRSGSKELDVGIFLKGDDVFSHHILVAGTTGRGKSVLVSNIIWNALSQEYCGMLVLDPHDEYYGRNRLGMKDHPNRGKVVYYTSKSPPPGARTLKINLRSVKPQHFSGVIELSDPQVQALYSYYKQYGERWVESIILEKPVDVPGFQEGTIMVARRKLITTLDTRMRENRLVCEGIFDYQAGEGTISDITRELEKGNVVIVDTSNLPGSVELLIGSMISYEVFGKYRHYNMEGSLRGKPVISIVLEEAPRVLGKEILERGQNIFSTIAREGRKFRVGLLAITQLPSLIPRDILANMNTKIILGIEMAQERQAVIESASQDLSDDNRNIASLDRGEAIVTSTFSRFATPLSIPFFDDEAKKQLSAKSPAGIRREFAGVSIS
jgi:DNA helicase HerA-like ATPase